MCIQLKLLHKMHILLQNFVPLIDSLHLITYKTMITSINNYIDKIN